MRAVVVTCQPLLSRPWFDDYDSAVNWCVVNGRANFTERIIRLETPKGSRFMVNTFLVGICEQLPEGDKRSDCAAASLSRSRTW